MALVKEESIKERRARKKSEEISLTQWTEDIRKVCEIFEGRKLLWKIMNECKVNQSILELSAKVYYNAGKQDVGHWLKDEIKNADINIYLKMESENYRGLYE